MRSGSGGVGIAGIAEHAKVVVRGGCAVQGKVRGGVAHRLRGEAIEQMCGGVQGLCPVAGKERHLKEKAIDHVGGGANDAFDPTVLGRGVGAREMQLDAMGEEEGTRGVVVELAAIITLEGTDRATELGRDLGEKVGEGGKRVGLQPKRESPQKMREVVYNDQVVFVTREVKDRRSPEITMDKIGPGRGGGKRKTRKTRVTTPGTGDIRTTGKLGHHVRSRVPETTMPDDRVGGSSKSMGGGYAGGGSGGQVNRVEGAGAVATSEHDTSGKVVYGEPLGIELYRTMVITSKATNREKGMSQVGSNKNIVKVEGSRKNRCTY
jgi:hypothetical protein